ncbi:MAG: UDP-3-O-(3-hydroxymyristoyl)glucosamine N-acyltransferase [Bacteroidetes bacterium]|nr:UDP-3-O-(3-hydroxymyristoyl)glucosamine N-acyltransferase [Bacteroidota bacterium]MBU1718502.1 UDP-3-O-(3-hydroxymyristoyl)glucosamine N-acyltransferase [Bacteroidota bacterium]
MEISPATTLQEIAAFLGRKFHGNPEFPVLGINELHKVRPGDVSFVDHPKYYDRVLNSSASVIIINNEVLCPEGKCLIFSDEPFDDYNTLVRHYAPFQPCASTISPSARIGANTIIQPNSFVGNNVLIGDNCIIHANVSIYDNSVIGNNVVIHSGTVIGADAYYVKKRSDGHYDKMLSCGRVVIEDDVEIGANCTIDRGVTADTRIGKGTKFDNHIQIGHDTVVGKNCLFASAVIVAGVTTIEDDVILWGQVAVHKDLTIGRGAVVLGMSGIDKSIEGGKTYFGSPAIDARAKWKELALIRSLPQMLDEIREKLENRD